MVSTWHPMTDELYLGFLLKGVGYLWHTLVAFTFGERGNCSAAI